MKRGKVKTPQFIALRKFLIQLIVKLQQVGFIVKLEATEKNLIVLKFFLILQIMQEIQLCNSELSLPKYQTISTILNYYDLNFVVIYTSVIQMIFLFITELVLLIAQILVYLTINKQQQNLLITITKYLYFAHHFILTYPLINTCFLILQNENEYYQIIASIGILLALIQALFFYFFTLQNTILEVEGCYSSRIQSILQFCCQIIISFLNTQNYDRIIIQTILLVYKIIIIYQTIFNYYYNTEFLQNSQLFFISYLVTLLSNLEWFEVLLYFVIFKYIIKTIRQRQFYQNINQINKGMTQQLFTIFQMNNNSNEIENVKLFFNLKSTQYCSDYQYHILMEQKINFKEKMILLQYRFKNKPIKLYLNLINTENSQLEFFEQIQLMAYIDNSLIDCQERIKSQLNVALYCSSMKIEQQSYQLLINIVDCKIKFYESIQKDTLNQKYLNIFHYSLEYTLKHLQNYKQKFDEIYNCNKIRMNEFNKSDPLSIIIISSFFYIFYNNSYKIKDIENKKRELCAYDKKITDKISENQTILISISYVQNKKKILNKKNKRLIQFIGSIIEPNFIEDLMPNFQKTIYENILSDYITQGFITSVQKLLYLQINLYLFECELYLHTTITNTDIIIHNFLVIKSDMNHFTIFDTDGKILGISNEIFNYLINKSDNIFNQQLQVGNLIQNGMIQYYIPDIIDQIINYCKLQMLPNQQDFTFIESRWQFPVNHKKCLEQTSNLGLITDDINTPSHFKKVFYSSSTRRMFNVKKSNVKEEIPLFKNTKLKIVQSTFAGQLKALIIYASRLKSLEFSGSLEFINYQCKEENNGYFLLRFKEIEDYQKRLLDQQKYEQNNPNLLLDDNENQKQEIDEDNYNFFNKFLNNEKMIIHFKYSWILIILLQITAIISLIINYYENQYNLVYFKNSIVFLQHPQALTHCFAGSYLLWWNKLCVEEDIFSISQEVEYLGEKAITLLKGKLIKYHLQYSLEILQSQEQFYSEYNVINNSQIITNTNLFQIYQISTEILIQQYLNFDSSNMSTLNKNLFLSTGYLRQNIFTLLTTHQLLLDNGYDQLTATFQWFTQISLLISLYSSGIILIILLMLLFIQWKLTKNQCSLIKQFQYCTPEILLNLIDILNDQKELCKQLYIKNYQKFDSSPTLKHKSESQISLQPFVKQQLLYKKFQDSQRSIQMTLKSGPLKKIENYTKYHYFPIILIIILGFELIIIIFGSQIITTSQSNKYYDSLILTINFLKLKTRLEIALLAGELIKTEHLIKENEIQFIDQENIIQLFQNNLNYLNNLTDIINDQLVITQSYNSSFQNKLIDMFSQNLCNFFQQQLLFCIPSQIQEPYNSIDNYSSVIDNGISGIIEQLNKIATSEYNYELTTYQYNENTNDKIYLNSQIHQNLFVQYFEDIQSTIYNCYLLIFNETQVIGNTLSIQILVYLIISSFVQVISTHIIAHIFIARLQNSYIQTKYTVTLFPPVLLEQIGFKKLLFQQLLNFQ